jgi:16S rRNA A1518/A1519 N6-dimethyltransferase RsmA/KsgA/DIM1 with predicted DNA glycosylase/AP lyase activity
MRAVTSRSNLFLLTLLTLPAFGQKFNADSLAPYIPSPQIVVDRMLEMAHIKPGETVYDLGSGDGRILITAAQKFRAKAIGIELSPELCQSTTARIEKLGLQDQVKVVNVNLLKVDLSPADVVTIYLLTSSNARLKPNLEKYLRPGARVVSNDFEIRGWSPKDISTLKVQGMPHTIYLYQIGKKGS